MSKLQQLCDMLEEANIPYAVDCKGVMYKKDTYSLHVAVLCGNMETYGNINMHYGSRTEWRENLTVEQVFNRIKWCNDGNNPLEYLPPDGKSMKMWDDSGLTFNKFAEVGDVVDIDIYNHFLNVLPPAYNGFGLMQVGEPVNHINGKATYSTFEKGSDGFWVYRGECFWGSCTVAG